MRIVFIILCSLLVTGEALACSCRPGTREETMNRSDLVVRGVIEHTTRSTQEFGDMAASVRVIETIKGRAPTSLTVHTAGNSAACGIALPEGQTLELALYEREGKYRASLCNQMGLGR